MSLGKRVVFTLIAMVAASFLVGLLWRGTFDARIPSYLSGFVGGVFAIAAWEFFRLRK